MAPVAPPRPRQQPEAGEGHHEHVARKVVAVDEGPEQRPALQRREQAVDALGAAGRLEEGDESEGEAQAGDESAEAHARRALVEDGRRRQVQREQRCDESESAPRVGERDRRRSEGRGKRCELQEPQDAVVGAFKHGPESVEQPFAVVADPAERGVRPGIESVGND